jgi:hypothetical protein
VLAESPRTRHRGAPPRPNPSKGAGPPPLTSPYPVSARARCPAAAALQDPAHALPDLSCYQQRVPYGREGNPSASRRPSATRTGCGCVDKQRWPRAIGELGINLRISGPAIDRGQLHRRAVRQAMLGRTWVSLPGGQLFRGDGPRNCDQMNCRRAGQRQQGVPDAQYPHRVAFVEGSLSVELPTRWGTVIDTPPRVRRWP